MRVVVGPPGFVPAAVRTTVPTAITARPRPVAALSGRRPGRLVAFALEGGGSYGAAQVGMLLALLDAGIVPDLVVGTSVGALNGAVLAARGDLRRSMGDLERLWRSIRRRDVLPLHPANALRALTGRGAGLVSNDGLGRIIDRWLPVGRLEHLALPFAAVATDIATGEAVVLRRGEARAALLASSALPGVYEPVRMGDLDLVDGGLVDNFPVAVAAELGATEIYALPTAVAAPTRLRPSAFALVQRASDVLVARASRRALEHTGGSVRVTELPAPATTRSVFDFAGSPELIDDGYHAARRWLADPTGR